MIEKKITFNSPITICRFTDDFNFLLIGHKIGFLYCYDDDFNEIYSQQLHLNQLKGIKFID